MNKHYLMRLISNVDYEINQKYDFGILNSLFDICYTESMGMGIGLQIN